MRVQQLPLFQEKWQPPWPKRDEPTPDVGDVVQLDGIIGAHEVETGRSRYMYLQRGVVTGLYAGGPELKESLFVRWRCVAAPPYYPYLHPLHDVEFISNRWDLRLSELIERKPRPDQLQETPS